MTAVHEARFYQPQPNNKVLYTLCPRDCRIRNNGRFGFFLRQNRIRGGACPDYGTAIDEVGTSDI